MSNWRRSNTSTSTYEQGGDGGQVRDRGCKRTGLRSIQSNPRERDSTPENKPVGRWVPSFARGQSESVQSQSVQPQSSQNSFSSLSTSVPSSERPNNYRKGGRRSHLKKHKEALQPNLRYRPSQTPPTSSEDFPSLSKPQSEVTDQSDSNKPSWSQLVSQGPNEIKSEQVESDKVVNNASASDSASASLALAVRDWTDPTKEDYTVSAPIVKPVLPARKTPDWLAELPEALEPLVDPVLERWLEEEASWDLKYHSYLSEQQSNY